MNNSVDKDGYDEIDRIIFEWIEDLEKNNTDRVYPPGLSGDFGWEHLKDFYGFVIKKERERVVDSRSKSISDGLSQEEKERFY